MFDQTRPAQAYPVLPLRDIVVFPHMIVPLFVGREKSVRALEDVMKEDKQILLVAQKSAQQDNPSVEDIHRVGTVASVLQLLKLPRQNRDGLLQLVEPILDVDRINPLGGGRRRQQEGDEDQEPQGQFLHDDQYFQFKHGHFQA